LIHGFVYLGLRNTCTTLLDEVRRAGELVRKYECYEFVDLIVLFVYHEHMTKSMLEEKIKTSPRVRAVIADVVREVLRDPDFGKELTPSMKRQLRAARKEKNLIPSKEVRRRLFRA